MPEETPPQTIPAPTPPKKRRKTAKRAVSVKVAGISSRNPFAPFADYILQTKVSPAIIEVIRTTSPTSMGALVAGYNKLTGSTITNGIMREWLKALNITFKKEWTFDLPDNEVLVAVKGKKQETSSKDTDEDAGFDGFDPIEKAVGNFLDAPAPVPTPTQDLRPNVDIFEG